MRRTPQGFTLLELLVSISILAVVTGMGTTAFFSLTSSWNDTKKLSDLNAMANGAFKSMQNDFDSIVSAELSGVGLVGVRSAVEDPRYFDRSLADDQIILPVTSNGVGGRDEQQRVMYRVVRTDDGSQTLVRTTGELSSEAPNSRRLDVIDRGNVVRLRFEYAADGRDGWLQAWNDGTLPRAVRVSLTLADKVRPDIQISRKTTFVIHVR